MDFEQNVVVLVLDFAEIEGEDFLLPQITICHLYFVLDLVYQQDLYKSVLLHSAAPLFLLVVLHKQLIAEGVSIGSFDPEREAEVGFIDKPKAVFEGDKFGLQKKSLLEDDGPFVVVLLLGGSELNDILGLLVDHDEGVKVEGITLVVAFLIVEAKFYYELFHVVVEMWVVIEFFLLALPEDELLFILAFFLDYLDCNIVAKLVFDDEEGHHCEIYHLLHTILQYI